MAGTKQKHSKHSICRRTLRGPPPEGEQNDDADGGGANRSWLRQRLGNLQSIELENKGSVARDHLALGSWETMDDVPPPRPAGRPKSQTANTHIPSRFLLILYRTDLSRLATHVPGLCVHWRRRDAAFPPKHDSVRWQRQRRQLRERHAPEAREAAWCDVSGHQHPDATAGREEVFPRAGVGDQGQVPGEQGDHPHCCAGGANDYAGFARGCHCDSSAGGVMTFMERVDVY